MRCWLGFRSRFTKADDFFAGLVLTTFFEEFDAFEALENVALGGDGAGSFEAAVLGHKSVKLSRGCYGKRIGWEGQKRRLLGVGRGGGAGWGEKNFLDAIRGGSGDVCGLRRDRKARGLR